MSEVSKPRQDPQPGRTPGSRLVNAVFGVAFAALALQAADALGGFGGTASSLLGPPVTVSVMFVAVLLTVAGAFKDRSSRLSSALLAAGMLSMAAGFLYFYAFQKKLTSFPTHSDLFWLGFYPFAYASVLILIRKETKRFWKLPVWLDGTIIVAVVAAIGYETVFQGALAGAGSKIHLVAGQLSYPMLDLGLVALMVGVCGLSGWRLRSRYFVWLAGFALLFAADTSIVDQLSQGTYAPGGLVDSGWPAGLALVALATRFGATLGRDRPNMGANIQVSTALAVIVAIAQMAAEFLERAPSRPVLILTFLVLVLVPVRLLMVVAANRRLADDNSRIIGSAGEGIFHIDLLGEIVSANPAAAKMVGWPVDDLIGRPAHDLFHHTRWDGSPYPVEECPILAVLLHGQTRRVNDEVFWRRDRSSFPVNYTTAPVREEGQVTGAVVVFDDVTVQQEMQDRLEHQASHDPLTGLFNRRHFTEELIDELRPGSRRQEAGALLLIDLDNFKFVNDSFGHSAGDRVLCSVASAIAARFRTTDVVARLGGDEFAVLLRGIRECDALHVAEEFLSLGRAGSTDISVGLSVGLVSFTGAEAVSAEDLMVAADVALYEAKEAGRGRVAVSRGRKTGKLTWVERIRVAIEDDRLVLFAQPIFDLRTGTLAQEELLVRLLDENGRLIPPNDFLPTAERFGLMWDIDRAVVSKALALARRGRRVSVNLSGHSIGNPELIRMVGREIELGLDPANVVFEITETAAVGDMTKAHAFTARLRKVGCGLALDDFGTGFGSFTYLKHIPVDCLKIDMEFVRDLTHNVVDRHVIEAIVAIARVNGQTTIAEGVEDQPTLELLKELGVGFAQGYHLGRPAPLDEQAGSPAQPASNEAVRSGSTDAGEHQLLKPTEDRVLVPA